MPLFYRDDAVLLCITTATQPQTFPTAEATNMYQRAIYRFEKWLQKTKRKAIPASVEKIKEELMLLDLISLMLGRYAKCGEIKCAEDVFNECTDGNVASWTLLIVGYMQLGQPSKTLKLLVDKRWIGILSMFHQSLNNSKKLNVVEAYIAPMMESDEGACEAIEQALIKINEDFAESVLKQKCAVCSPCSISSDESQTQKRAEPLGTNDNDGNSMTNVPAQNSEAATALSSVSVLMRELPELRPGWPLIRQVFSSGRQESDQPLKEDESTDLDHESGAIVPVNNETLSHHTPPLTNSRCLPIGLEDLHESYLSTCRMFKYPGSRLLKEGGMMRVPH